MPYRPAEVFTPCLKPDRCYQPAAEDGAFECPRLRNNPDARRYYDRSPLVRAEDLCVRALTEFSQTTANKDPYRQTYNDSVENLELSMAHHDPDERVRYFDAFSRQNEALLADFQPESTGRLTAYIEARLQNIFAPVFMARVEWRRPTPEEMSQVHSDLCDFIGCFREDILSRIPKGDHATRKLMMHYLVEATEMGLLTRTNDESVFPYPALRREESSHARSELNHDYYAIPDRYKHPLQSKTSKRSSGYRVPVVSHREILFGARRGIETITYVWEENGETWPPDRHKFEQTLEPTKIPDVEDLLIMEKELGRRIDSDSLSLLNLATAQVVAKIVGYTPPELRD